MFPGVLSYVLFILPIILWMVAHLLIVRLSFREQYGHLMCTGWVLVRHSHQKSEQETR